MPVPLATLPMRTDDRVPVVAVQIHGKRVWVALDTGATCEALDTQAARRLGIATTGSTAVTGIGGGNVAASNLADFTIAIGNAHFDANNTLAIGIAGKFAVREVEGTLGWDFFKQYVVEIDYGAHVVRVYDPRTYRYRGGGEAIALAASWHAMSLIATLRVPGVVESDRALLVDTGSSHKVDDDIVFKSHGRKSVTQSGGIGIPHLETLGVIDSVTFGSFELRDVATYGGSSPRIGSGALAYFDVVLDFANSRMYLKSQSH